MNIDLRRVLLKYKKPFSSHGYLHLIIGICLTTACSKSQDSNTQDTSVKFKQYYLQGEQLYINHCSNCHQKNGTGLGLVYPPLNKSDFMKNNFEDVICLIRNGRTGELFVNGKNYNQPMPPNTVLTDLEIAEIATYIYNTWEHRKGMIEVREVTKILGSCEKP